VKKQHLKGVMFWDYEGDPSGVLLDAIDTALKSETAYPFTSASIGPSSAR